MKPKIDINRKIDEAFAPYEPTVTLLQTFLREKTNIHEFILLVCARLDSLSNIAFSGGSQQENFVKFLLQYSGFSDWFTRISLPDLYYHLSYHLWVLPGTVGTPGRLHVFDPREEKEIVSMFWKSELGLTEKDLGMLLRFFLRTLKSWYRVVPNQTLARSTYDSPEHVGQRLKKLAAKHWRGTYSPAARAMAPVIAKFSLAVLLYKEYRCGAIHRYHVNLNEKAFFTRQKPYWCPFYNDVAEPGSFLKVHFPGPFLLATLQNSIASYKKHLKAKGQLPADMFFEVCDTLRDLGYLDDDSIPLGRDVNVSL
jgi:hypothetical protein